ncbi:MAG TPA: LamG-like jellyroll fold domain-containing protein [Polyangiaceae bacterium]
MGRRTRGWLTAATVLVATSCSLVAPLDGLTGGSSPQTDDAAFPRADTGASDAPADRLADVSRDSTAPPDAAPDTSMTDAAPDTSPPDADASIHDSGAGSPDAETGAPDADASVDAPPDSPSSVYRAAVLADAPLAYWRLGETSGTVAHDETGHGYDGTYTGTYTLGTAGALAGDANTAVTLDGVTGQVDVGDNFDFVGQVPFSFEAWVKPAVIDSEYRHIVTKMAFDGSGNPQTGTYVLLQKGTTILGFERWQAGDTLLAVEDSVFPAAGSWAHVVATYDGNLGTLYVNGAQVQAATSGGGIQASGVHLLLGNLIQGVLDEIAVYGTALPAARVTAHYQAAQ